MLARRVSSPPILQTSIAAISLAILGGASATTTPETLRETEAQIRQLARSALPSTVSLAPGGDSRRFGMGSGVIVSPDGLILTAAHVAMEMDEEVTVLFSDGSRARGRVLGMDYTRDSAMVQIVDKGVYPFLELGNSRGLVENQWCIALGHAGGYQADRTPPLRLGRVIFNNEKRFITSDCALIGGDSGGPLLDVEGRIIGIHSNIGVSLSQNNHVPISAFQEKWDRLLAGERFGGDEPGSLLRNPDRPMIGAVLGDPKDGPGSAIRQVLPGSPADKAGLAPGDIILKLLGIEISDTDALLREVRRQKAGDQIQLLVRRGGDTLEITLHLVSARKLQHWLGPEQSEIPFGEGSSGETADPAELQEEFNQRMRESIESGHMQFQPGELRRFGGPEKLMDLLEEFEKSATPAEMEELLRMGQEAEPIRPRTFDPDQPNPIRQGFFREVLDGFRPAVSHASESIHLVFRGSEWKSLCTVVHPDGYALTKASEINTKNNQALRVLLSKGVLRPAEVVKTFSRYDLALLKIRNAPPLVPAEWHIPEAPLELGTLLAAAGPGPDALALGLVSVQTRSMSGRNKGFLGIGTAPHSDGVRVTQILPEGNAGKAGIRAGDIITQVNGTPCETPEKLIKEISGAKPGEEVNVRYLRNGRPYLATIELADRHHLDRNAHMFMDRTSQYGTEVSKRISDYPNALQNDLPIQPQECGGAVVDLNGRIVGLNIARAGRIKTYALTSREIQNLLDRELPKLVDDPVIR